MPLIVTIKIVSFLDRRVKHFMGFGKRNRSNKVEWVDSSGKTVSRPLPEQILAKNPWAGSPPLPTIARAVSGRVRKRASRQIPDKIVRSQKIHGQPGCSANAPPRMGPRIGARLGLLIKDQLEISGPSEDRFLPQKHGTNIGAPFCRGRYVRDHSISNGYRAYGLKQTN